MGCFQEMHKFRDQPDTTSVQETVPGRYSFGSSGIEHPERLIYYIYLLFLFYTYRQTM